jgi:molybdenum-dependent DNA-binding transcriptional regulator ModE
MLNGTKTVIKHKIGLLNLAEELGNVSKTCRIMGLSRYTFYRYQKAIEQGGINAIVDQNRRKPNIKNRTDETTEAAVVAYAVEQPAYGQVRASNELRTFLHQKLDQSFHIDLVRHERLFKPDQFIIAGFRCHWMFL